MQPGNAVWTTLASLSPAPAGTAGGGSPRLAAGLVLLLREQAQRPLVSPQMSADTSRSVRFLSVSIKI